jgi:hypothetical protein
MDLSFHSLSLISLRCGCWWARGFNLALASSNWGMSASIEQISFVSPLASSRPELYCRLHAKLAVANVVVVVSIFYRLGSLNGRLLASIQTCCRLSATPLSGIILPCVRSRLCPVCWCVDCVCASVMCICLFGSSDHAKLVAARVVGSWYL